MAFLYVPEVSNVQMNKIKKIDLFVWDFFKKWKGSTSSKENVIFLGVPFSIIPLKHRKKSTKVYNFLEIKEYIFYSSNYRQGDN